MSKTALITGASGGIGYELALLFARDGFDCNLVARSQDKLKQLAARLESEHRIKTLVLPKDLSKPGAVDEIYEEVSAASMAVDVLVNNAGFPVFGPFVEKTIVIPGLTNRLVPWIARVSPRSMATRVVHWMQERVPQ